MGRAFNEASVLCLVRTSGSDSSLVDDAASCARKVGVGHRFCAVIGPGTTLINALERVKGCSETCRSFCASANPLEIVVARSARGVGILSVIDEYSPSGLESDADKGERRAMLKRFGYKIG